MRVSARRNRSLHFLEQGYEELDILAALDFKVTEFSEYHHRINDRLDVWVSTKRWHDRARQTSGDYTDLVELVKKIFLPASETDL